MADTKQVSVEENGEIVAQATVSAPDAHHAARAQVSVAPGHLPAGTRQKVADAVYQAVTDDNAGHLTAAVPQGDAELIAGICNHLSDVELRAAGATCIIEGDVKPQ